MTAEFVGVCLAAFMAGLLGNGHCFAMCGGIAGGLGTTVAGKQGRAAGWPAMQFNLGRITGYATTGAVTAVLLGSIPSMPGLQVVAFILRLLTAMLVFLMGMHYLLGFGGLKFLEQLGARVWKRILPLARRFTHKPGALARFILGLFWGFLPCGLVYTLLMTAASTGRPDTGALVMLSFGLGTLPAMLGLTLAAPALSTILRDQQFRRFVGFSLVLLAVWMALSTLDMNVSSAPESSLIHHH